MTMKRILAVLVSLFILTSCTIYIHTKEYTFYNNKNISIVQVLPEFPDYVKIKLIDGPGIVLYYNHFRRAREILDSSTWDRLYISLKNYSIGQPIVIDSSPIEGNKIKCAYETGACFGSRLILKNRVLGTITIESKTEDILVAILDLKIVMDRGKWTRTKTLKGTFTFKKGQAPEEK